jgi:hypothetical protein
MNYIGGALLIHCDEVVTFWLLTTLFESYEVREVFDNNLLGSIEKLSYLDELIREHLPTISSHFEEIGVSSSIFA